jgi:hypothetical protein
MPNKTTITYMKLGILKASKLNKILLVSHISVKDIFNISATVIAFMANTDCGQRCGGISLPTGPPESLICRKRALKNQLNL